MKQFCQYKFIVGQKKGQECGRFIRKAGENCWQHSPHKKEPKTVEQKVDQKVEQKVESKCNKVIVLP